MNERKKERKKERNKETKKECVKEVRQKSQMSQKRPIEINHKGKSRA